MNTADKPDKYAQIKEVTDMLEEGVKSVFTSERYLEYLNFLTKFHKYSVNNCILIMMQNPNASYVAGFNDWKNKHNRYVKKGEKGIKIIAPAPYKTTVEVPVLDSNKQPVIIDGKPLTEKKVIDRLSFRVVSVFDVSQTDGEPLPSLAPELTASVANYQDLLTAICETSDFNVKFEDISGGAKGLCNYLTRTITIKPGMSQAQTIKTATHEEAHARLHDTTQNDIDPISRETKEVQAESIAYVVANYFGIDTSDYSFDYIANWSTDKEIEELQESLEVIQKEAGAMIDIIEAKYAEILRTKETIIKTTDVALSDLVSSHREYIADTPNERNTVVINAFAGPGAGKTTSCLEICAGLKKAGIVAEYVQEYAKELVWEGRTDMLSGSTEGQLHILQEQLSRMDRLYGKVDFIVTDCPILLPAIYLKESNRNFEIASKELFGHFSNFNYFVERDISTFETKGRIHNLEESLQIDETLKTTLSSLGLQYGTYNHSTIQNIVKDAITYRDTAISNTSKAITSESPIPVSVESITISETDVTAAEHTSPSTETLSNRVYNQDTDIASKVRDISIVDYASRIGFTIQKVGSYYTLKEHDSVRIDPRSNRYFRNSTGERGSVIDFVMEFENVSNTQAISQLARYLGSDHSVHSRIVSSKPREKKTKLELPKKGKSMKNIFAYLIQTRKISPEIVNDWVAKKNLYQDINNNCVFVTFDSKGKPAFASQRGTNTNKPFKADVPGSNYDICHFINNGASTLIVGEAVIDIMSVQTIMKAHGRDLSKYNYLSLNGSTKTHAVINALQSSKTDTVILATDNDTAGQIARDTLRDLIFEHSSDIKVVDYVPTHEKDWNAELVATVLSEESQKTPTEPHLSDVISSGQARADKIISDRETPVTHKSKNEQNL